MNKNIHLILIFFKRYYVTHKIKLILYLFSLFAHRFFSLLLPIYMKLLIDTAVNMQTHSINELHYYGIMNFGVLLLFILFLVLRNYWGDTVTIDVETDLKKRGIEKISKIDYPTIQGKDNSFFIQRIMSDIEQSSDLMFYDFSLFIANLLYFVGLIYIMMTLSPVLTLLLILFIPLFLITTRYYIPKIKLMSEKIRHNDEDLTQVLEEAKSGALTIKLFLLYDYFHRKLSRVVKKRLFYRKRNMRYHIAYDFVIVAGLMNIASLVIYWIGGLFVFRHMLSIGSLVALSLYFSKLWTPAEYFMDFPKTLNIKLVSFFRIKEFFDLPEEDFTLNGKKELVSFKTLHINDVSLDYEDAPVLKGIMLKVNKNEKILIKGDNGSGKTTLLMIIAGLIKPGKGGVLINGNDISSYALNALRRCIVFIPQTSYLFKGPLHSYLSGYDAIGDFNTKRFDKKKVAENGTNLSGGEKKMIQLMRGLENRGDLYLLDEPLSSVDKSNRQAFIDQIKALFKDKTLIIVSHQDDFNELVDRKLVLLNGMLQEES